MSTEPITIAMAGTGKVTYNHLSELIDDYLGVTDEGDLDRDTNWVLPVAAVTQGEVEDAMIRYLDELELDYIAVTDGTAVREQRKIVRNAHEEDEVDEDGDLSNGVIGRLVAAKQAGDEAVLFLAWGSDDDDAPDALAAQLLADAVDNDIPVLDLTAGLVDLTFKTEAPAEDEEPQDEDDDPEDEEVPPVKTSRRTPKAPEKAPAEVPDKAAEEVRRVFLSKARRVLADAEAVYQSLSVLTGAEEKYTDAIVDLHELLTNIEVREEELAKVVSGVDALTPSKALVEAKTTTRRRDKDPEPDAPAPRGRARAAAVKNPGEMVKVVETGDGTYKKLGRGRPPAVGAKTKTGTVVEITKEQFDALDFS